MEWMEMAGKIRKLLEMTVNCWNGWKGLNMAGKGWKGLEMAVHYWKWMEIAEMARNG